MSDDMGRQRAGTSDSADAVPDDVRDVAGLLDLDARRSRESMPEGLERSLSALRVGSAPASLAWAYGLAACMAIVAGGAMAWMMYRGWNAPNEVEVATSEQASFEQTLVGWLDMSESGVFSDVFPGDGASEGAASGSAGDGLSDSVLDDLMESSL